jgi:glycosyltransferase involved in cell wall biosynthesis
MKTRRQDPPQDLCQTSIELLLNRLKPHFNDEKLWVPDHPEHFYQNDHSKIGENAILMGGFLRRVAEIPLWPEKPFRLWVLNSKVKQVMVELLHFPESAIGVVPRDRIEKRVAPAMPLDLDQPFTIFCSGRVSAVKNIEGICHFVHALQKLGAHARLVIQGDFDNDRHENEGRRTLINFEGQLKACLQGLDWSYPPELLPKVDPNDWLVSEHPQKIYTSFSTYWCEDFNMGLTQAREAGWPILISDWGGNGEMIFAGEHLIDGRDIPSSHGHEAYLKGKAEALAKKFLNKKFQRNEPRSENHGPQSELPRALDVQERREIYAKNLARWGREFLALTREQLDFFADTNAGGEFFYRAQKILRGQSARKKLLVFLPHETAVVQPQPQALYELGKKAVLEEYEVYLVSDIDLRYKDVQLMLAEAEETQFIECPALEKKLKEIL